MTASPVPRHQLVAPHLAPNIADFGDEAGRYLLIAPTDLYFTESTVVVPEYWFVDLDQP